MTDNEIDEKIVEMMEKKAEMETTIRSVAQLTTNLAAHIKELGKNTTKGSNSTLLTVLDELRSACVTDDIFYDNFGNVLLSFVGNGDELGNEAIKLVSALLEMAGSCRQVIWLNCDRIYERLLTGIDRSSLDTHYDRLHLSVRVVLKVEQHLFDRWKTQRSSNSSYDIDSLSQRIGTTLIRVMNNLECPLESVFLAGTAFAFYLHSLDVPLLRRELSALISVQPSLETALSELGLNETEAKKCLTDGVANGRSVQLPFIHGLLVCGKSDILLSRFDGSTSSGCEEGGLLILKVLPIIAEFCDGGDHRVYQSYQTLLSWLIWMRVNLNRVTATMKHKKIFGFNDLVAKKLFRILDLGFSSFVTGVPDLSWDAYDILLEVHKMEGGNGFLDLLQQVMKLPWTVKGKYPPLAMLVRHLGTATLLLHFPCFLDSLCESLVSNPLASLGSAVYRNLLTHFRSECMNLTEEEIASRWETTFLPSMLTTLATSDSICLQNLIRHWLPIAIKMFPKAYTQLCSNLTGSRSSPNTLLALTSVLRLARSFGIATFKDVERPVLNEALHHSDENVRAEAYAIVCLSHKKSELVSMEEIEVLKLFVPMNMNIVNPAFRGKIFCHTKGLLVRLRDSCLNLLTKWKRTGDTLRSSQSENVECELLQSMNFLDWFLCLLLDNLRLGGCYQRRHTCLNLYKILLEVFVSAPNKNCRKGIVPAKCCELLQFFLKRGKFDLFSDRATRLLLFCILDYMEEIQSLAVGILRGYFPCHLHDRKEYTDWALHLCSSPKSMHGESGSRVFVFVFQGLDHSQRIEMIELILRKLTEQLAIAEMDMLVASSDAPMHGLVLALRHCICFYPNFWCENGDRSKGLLEECLGIAERIVGHVLSILASKSDTEEVAPSFEEMGLAIEDIVGLSENDDPSVSIEHQLVSSCCWLSLKECSLLLGSMVEHLTLEGSVDGYHLSLHQVKRVSRVMYSILTKCRHRGAIEACNLGLEVFSRKLLGSGQPSQTRVVVMMLELALSELLNTASQTSVTRRSAGLPLLAVTVVKNDQRPCRPLLIVAVKRLLDVAESSLVDDDSIGGVVDVPRAHSFHVLRALVHESVLSQDILFHMNAIVPACLKGFFSSSWAVRNASLQLFGAIVPRLIGQKKVADDESDHNGMTFSDFCVRWPALIILFKSYVRDIDFSEGKTDLGETVVPMLSLFCRLSSDVSSAEGTEIVSLISPLLGCPVWHVRRQAAVFVARMCPKDRLGQLFMELSHSLCESCKSFNHAHGLLLTMLNVARNLEPSYLCPDLVVKLRQSFSKVSYFVLNTFRCPILSSAVFDVSFALPRSLQFLFDMNKLSDLKVTYLDWEPGFGSLIKAIVTVHSRELPIEDLISYFRAEMSLSSEEEVEAFLLVLRQRMVDSDNGASSENHNSIQQLLLKLCETYKSSTVLRTCLQLMLDIYFHFGVGFNIFDTERVLKVATFLLSETNGGFSSAVAIGLWALVIIKDNRLESTDTNKWVERLNHFCQSRLSEEFRLGAAKGLMIGGSFVLKTILSLRGSDSFRDPDMNDSVVGIFDSSLTLLQDEEPDVRNQATKFVASLCVDQSGNCEDIHPNVAIDLLGDYFLCKFGWNDKLWIHLWTKMAGDLSNFTSVSFKISHSNSLFDQDDVNVYAEKCFMSTFYSRLLRGLLSNCDVRQWFSERVLENAAHACEAVRYLYEIEGADNMSVYCVPRVALHILNLHSCLEVHLAYSPLSEDLKEAFDKLRVLIGLK